MTGLLLALLLTQPPAPLVTSEQFRARFAEVAARRQALEARRAALPWLKGSGALATGLLGAGVLYLAVAYLEPQHRGWVPTEAVLVASGLNLLGAVALGVAVRALERSLEEDGPAVERQAARLRAAHAAQLTGL